MGKILASPYLGLERGDLDDTGRHPNHCVHRTLGVIPYKSLLKVDRLTLHEFAWDQTSPWLFSTPCSDDCGVTMSTFSLCMAHSRGFGIPRWSHTRPDLNSDNEIQCASRSRLKEVSGGMPGAWENVEASLTPHPLPIIPLFDVPRAWGVNLTCDGDEAETKDRVDSNLRAPPPSSSSSGFSGNSPSSNPSAYLSYFLISRFRSSLFPLLFSLDSLLKSQKKTPPPQSFSQPFIATPANPF
ncbi:hypothetical protein VNO77_43453 [Canavalia gladiata]|uniref:Uncharacterized protein n=1 Tax=Canavalia gladiata TaxID=3824 RepID=A0AAN9JUV3_CANGL